MDINITEAQRIYRDIVPKEFRDKYFDLGTAVIKYGYNIYNSFRAGGKTVNELIFCLIAKIYYNKNTCYLRTNNKSTVAKMVKTICDALNKTVDDNGDNYVTKISNGKYNWVDYHTLSKSFRLLQNEGQDVKTGETFMYVFSLDQSLDAKSGFADVDCDIILYDEFVDTYVTANTPILLLNFISTVFRMRYNSIVLMNCNMSIGNPLILRALGVYEKVLNQTTSYMQYHNKKGTVINVTLLSVKEAITHDRMLMNERYFNLDYPIDGLENIRGTTITQELFRTLPDDKFELEDTIIYYYACGKFLKVQIVSSYTYQPLMYISETNEPPHNSEHIILTDDKAYAFTHPWSYYSILRDNKLCVQIAKHVRRDDICYQNYMCYISIKSFYDFFRIPDNI